MRKYIFETPRRKKQTKTDTSDKTDMDGLGQAMNRAQDYPSVPEPEKQAEPPKTAPKLRSASADKTRQSTAGIQLPQDALDKLRNMNIDTTGEPEIPTPTFELVKPETLPKVINTELKAAGMQEPEWHMIRNLPGYMVRAIRALGRPLFGTQTKTQLEKIQCIANVMGQGPNTMDEINAVAQWASDNGWDLGHGDIDFSGSIPGYNAEIHQFATKDVRFMLVKDDYGAYVYAWPEKDSLRAVGSENDEVSSFSPETRRLAEELHFKFLENKRTVMRLTSIEALLEEFNEGLDITLLESEQKIQFIAQQMAGKLLAAIGEDNSRVAREFAMKLKSAIGIHRQPSEPGSPPGEQPKVDVIPLVRELSKADPTGERHDYLQFIVRMYVLRQFMLEDIPRLLDELTKFIRFRSKIQNKDLNSYKSLNDLYDIIEKAEAEFGDAESIKSKSQQEKETKIEGADVIINEPNIKVVHLKTAQAATLYAAGTKWCTSNAGTFQHYAKQGAIYVIIAKGPTGPRKFQMHYESEQVMNERDQSISPTEIKLLSDLPSAAPGEPNGWTKFLNYMIQLKYSKYFDNKKEEPAAPKKKAAARRPTAE